MPPQNQAPRLMTASELGRVLRVPERSVYEWARAGKIPSVKVGDRLVRFDPDAVIRAGAKVA